MRASHVSRSHDYAPIIPIRTFEISQSLRRISHLFSIRRPKSVPDQQDVLRASGPPPPPAPSTTTHHLSTVQQQRRIPTTHTRPPLGRDPAMSALPRQKALPQQWADEMALASSTLSSSDADHPTPSPPDTLGGHLFDHQLDGFLDRFQQEIVVARALKDDLDRVAADDAAYQAKKHNFKLKMERIRALFATEGEEFVESLERRNPKLTMAACGENTIELAQGIDRLETAVKEEETKRAAITGSRSAHHQDAWFTPKSTLNLPLAKPADRQTIDATLPHSNGPAAVGHTLNNLSSDETLQLMQSDIQALKLELMRLQRSKANPNQFPSAKPPKPPTSDDHTTAVTYSMSTLSPDAKPTAVPASILANNNVSVVRVTGRANNFAPTYVSHLEQMKSRLEALEKKPLSRRAKSAARLGRTQTMGSMYEPPSMMTDENQNPNVSAMVTPPRLARRMKHRSISTQSPLQQNSLSPASLDKFRPVSSPQSSPSPTKETKGREGGKGAPARLFFDAPEEMLSRPQSHAAAKDIQRYSLKVARRFGPSEPVLQPEPRARSAVTVSPTRRRGVADSPKPASHTLSDVGAGNVGPPSTIDTSGSGGRVVEEIEGDMWVRKGVVWKRWRRRYASIVSHQFFGKVMCLFSYDSSGGVISTRSQIVVLHGSLCRALREKIEIAGMERFMFVLRTSTKEYYFAAETDEIRRNWIRELRDAARKDNIRLMPSMGRSMAFRKRP